MGYINIILKNGRYILSQPPLLGSTERKNTVTHVKLQSVILY